MDKQLAVNDLLEACNPDGRLALSTVRTISGLSREEFEEALDIALEHGFVLHKYNRGLRTLELTSDGVNSIAW